MLFKFNDIFPNLPHPREDCLRPNRNDNSYLIYKVVPFSAGKVSVKR